MELEVFGAVLVTLVVLMVGALLGSGLNLLLVRRQRRLEAARDRQLRTEMAEEISGQIAEVLEQVMGRVESMEERLEFSERLMLERGAGPSRGPDAS